MLVAVVMPAGLALAPTALLLAAARRPYAAAIERAKQRRDDSAKPQ
jgi:hypothetical protein